MSLDFEKTELLEGNVLMVSGEDGKMQFYTEERSKPEVLAMFAEFREKYPNGKPKIVDLEALRASKIQDLSDACTNTITKEFFSDVDGTLKRYDFELENQFNLNEYASELKDAKRSGADISVVKISYYAKSEPCHDYTGDQLLTLATQGKYFKLANIQQYKDNLKLKVEAATTEDEINTIVWEPIPSMNFIDVYKMSLVAPVDPTQTNANSTSETGATGGGVVEG